MKVKTRTNLSDVTFTEILLRGRFFKTSRNILTVMVQSLQQSDVMPWLKKRSFLNSLNNFFSSYQETKVTL